MLPVDVQVLFHWQFLSSAYILSFNAIVIENYRKSTKYSYMDYNLVLKGEEYTLLITLFQYE